uniref:Uncharacterized protein n=1 Tax=Amphimedon queenslandica TaxID=400682 RepID=A0A1X7STB0_AMPQE
MDCLYEKVFVFTNVTEGDEYNYTVTITNVIGSAVTTGSIVIPYSPVVVCPSEVQYSPSTMMMISHISSVMESSTPAIVSSSSCNCVLPWTVGVLIGAVAGMIVVSLLVIVFVILIKIRTRVKIDCTSFNKGSDTSELSSPEKDKESTESSGL